MCYRKRDELAMALNTNLDVETPGNLACTSYMVTLNVFAEYRFSNVKYCPFDLYDSATSSSV